MNILFSLKCIYQMKMKTILEHFMGKFKKETRKIELTKLH